MKKVILVVVVIVVLILFYRAWTKDTVEVEVAPPTGRKYRRKTLIDTINTPFPKPNRSGKLVRSTRENKCRDIFEYLFQEPFPTKRPSFLKNPETGRNLELDGYNPKLQVGFEYNGRQHYDFPNTFHKTKEEFLKQVERDRFKEQRCRDTGVTLITIPDTVPDESLESFIRAELEKKGFEYS